MRKKEKDRISRRETMSGISDGAGARKKARFQEDIKKLDPDNRETLEKFVTEHGKIIPARISGISSKDQRRVKKAVKRARNLAIL